ncbi:spermidine/putrescine ABC transporter ATP-binding protein, partial [Microbacterium testaceum]|nr:spermidine/putrescine ABC transporter ATP-binding protein [Microbacterium testaceum]
GVGLREKVVVVSPAAPGLAAGVAARPFLAHVRRPLVRPRDGSLVHVDHAADARLDDHARVRIALAQVPVATRPLS